jgi:hypothetical protein
VKPKEVSDWANTALRQIETDYAVARQQRDNTVRQAESLLAKHDYAAAEKLLLTIPDELHGAESRTLLFDTRAALAQVASLRREIHNNIAILQYKGLKSKALQLLALQPDGDDVKKLIAQLEKWERKQEDQFWQSAVQQRSVEAFRQYLLAYPAGVYVKQANEAVAAILHAQQEQAWQSVLQARTVETCRQYLTQYPDGAHSEEAKKVLVLFMREKLCKHPKDKFLRQEYLDCRTPECLEQDRADAQVKCRFAYMVVGGMAGAIAGAFIGGIVGGLGAWVAGAVFAFFAVLVMDM